jgi:beta-galactosidase
MKRIPINFDWKRAITDKESWLRSDTEFTPVDLPDDFILNLHRTPDSPGRASTGFFPGGQAVYKKELVLSEDTQDKTVLIGFDGAYMNAEVSLNHQHLMHHPYGYTAFFADLTQNLREAGKKNYLQVTTQCRLPGTRWYSGGGLFREVSLYIGGKAYIHPWEVFITTPDVSSEEATVNASINVTNTCCPKEAKLVVSIIAGCGTEVAREETGVHLAEKTDTRMDVKLTVKNPRLWDVDDPNLYTMKITVMADGQELDAYESKFGIRTIAIDAENGFRLNGRKLKLRGGCIHHDNTLLGACAYPRAEERKIQLLKDTGYNAIRTAHNPPSTAMLDICDRLGMLVLDETFDMWTMGKNPLDYHLYFEQWWEFDTTSMVKRDRNHPSIYCWSIGNEIPEITGKSNGALWAKKQADLVRSLDPTRPVTSAIHGGTDTPLDVMESMPPMKFDWKKILTGEMKRPFGTSGEDRWGNQTKAAIEALDIVGYNYLHRRYESDKGKFPGRVIHATETHPFNTYDYWQAVEENEHVIGDFIWTAYDNLGEAGAGRVIWDLNEPMEGLVGQYPWLSCYQGDYDLDGNRRPQSYFRKIMWHLDDGIHVFTTHPSRTGTQFYGMGWHWQDVKKDWTFDAEYVGKQVKVEAYSDCDEIEFLVNGESFGKAKVEKLKAEMEVTYTPGKLEAVAWKNGKAVARDEILTSGPVARIKLTADREVIHADGMDLCFIKVELLDANGILAVSQPYELTAAVSGAGKLAGFGSGNPKTTEDYGTGRRRTFDGRALIAVRADRNPGEIRVAVVSDTLPAAEIIVKAE